MMNNQCGFTLIRLLNLSGATAVIPLAQPVSRPKVVSTGSPVKDGLVPLPMPSLPSAKDPSKPVDGITASAPLGIKDAKDVHEATFSDGFDLSDPPRVGDPSPDASCSDPANPFCDYIPENTTVPHTSTADFGKVLGQAIEHLTTAGGARDKISPNRRMAWPRAASGAILARRLSSM
jgi:hypothetical protein